MKIGKLFDQMRTASEMRGAAALADRHATAAQRRNSNAESVMILDLAVLEMRARAIGLTLAELARLAGITESAVYKAARKKRYMRIENLVRLNAVLTEKERTMREHLQGINKGETRDVA